MLSREVSVSVLWDPGPSVVVGGSRGPIPAPSRLLCPCVPAVKGCSCMCVRATRPKHLGKHDKIVFFLPGTAGGGRRRLLGAISRVRSQPPVVSPVAPNRSCQPSVNVPAVQERFLLPASHSSSSATNGLHSNTSPSFPPPKCYDSCSG